MRPRTIITVVVLLAALLTVAGIAAAEGPQGVNQLTLPFNGVWGGPGIAFQVRQTSATRGGGDPAIYGEGNATDGGWFISQQNNGLLAAGRVGAYVQGREFGVFSQNIGSGPGLYAVSSTGQGVIGVNNSSTRRSTPGVQGTGVAEDGGWFLSQQANGVYAFGRNTGIWGDGVNYGVIGTNQGGGPGVFGRSSVSMGVLGLNDSTVRRSTPAVQGQANAEDGGWFLSAQSNGVFGSGPNAGVWASGGSQGLLANATNGNGINTTGSQHGIFATGAQDGVFARGGADGIDTRSTSGNRSALFARNESNGTGITVESFNGEGVIVRSDNNAVVGRADGDGANGVVGIARNGDSPYAIWGQGDGDWAGYFSGNVRVTGSIDEGLAAVKMDDPRAPTERYINQAAVVGGDMLTLYNGNVTTDAKGMAVVKVPDYAEAIAKDFRYQLTPIGQFAQAIIAKELSGGQFVIQTDKPFVKVSWQVSGVRADAYAQSARYKTVEDKTGDAKGTYFHPEAYGQSKSLGVDAKRIAALDAKLEASKAEYAAKDAGAAKSAPDLAPRPEKQPSLPALVQPSAQTPADAISGSLDKLKAVEP